MDPLHARSSIYLVYATSPRFPSHSPNETLADSEFQAPKRSAPRRKAPVSVLVAQRFIGVPLLEQPKRWNLGDGDGKAFNFFHSTLFNIVKGAPSYADLISTTYRQRRRRHDDAMYFPAGWRRQVQDEEQLGPRATTSYHGPKNKLTIIVCLTSTGTHI